MVYSGSVPYLVVSVIFFAIYIPIVILFVLRRHLEPINSRGWQLVLVSSIFSFWQFHLMCWETFASVDPDISVSCHFMFWSNIVFVPMFGLPYFLRSAILYTKYRFNISKMLDKPEEIWLQRNKFISNPSFTLGIMLIFFVGTIVIASALQFPSGAFFPPNSERYCVGSDLSTFIYLIHVVILIILFTVAVIKTWGINDAFEIKTELKVLIIAIAILFVPFIIRNATSLIPPEIDGSFFLLPILAIAFFVSVAYPVYLTYKLQNDRYERMSTISNDDIKAIISNMDALFRFVMESKIMRKEFQQYCVESWCVENFLFYRDVYEFTRIEEFSELHEEAKKIAEMYIGEGTPRQINIDVHAVNSVVNRIQNNDVDKDIFHLALSQVETQMKQDTLSHWKQTSAFSESIKRAQQEEANELSPIKFSIDVS